MRQLSCIAFIAGGVAGALVLATSPAFSQGTSAIDKSNPAASKQDTNLKPIRFPLR